MNDVEDGMRADTLVANAIRLAGRYLVGETPLADDDSDVDVCMRSSLTRPQVGHDDMHMWEMYRLEGR
jgi:hypothetical protein